MSKGRIRRRGKKDPIKPPPKPKGSKLRRKEEDPPEKPKPIKLKLRKRKKRKKKRIPMKPFVPYVSKLRPLWDKRDVEIAENAVVVYENKSSSPALQILFDREHEHFLVVWLDRMGKPWAKSQCFALSFITSLMEATINARNAKLIKEGLSIGDMPLDEEMYKLRAKTTRAKRLRRRLSHFIKTDQ